MKMTDCFHGSAWWRTSLFFLIYVWEVLPLAMHLLHCRRIGLGQLFGRRELDHLSLGCSFHNHVWMYPRIVRCRGSLGSTRLLVFVLGIGLKEQNSEEFLLTGKPWLFFHLGSHRWASNIISVPSQISLSYCRYNSISQAFSSTSQLWMKVLHIHPTSECYFQLEACFHL